MKLAAEYLGLTLGYGLIALGALFALILPMAFVKGVGPWSKKEAD